MKSNVTTYRAIVKYFTEGSFHPLISLSNEITQFIRYTTLILNLKVVFKKLKWIRGFANDKNITIRKMFKKKIKEVEMKL